MAIERERKFLVNQDKIELIPKRNIDERIVQMYIVDREDHSLRIRLTDKFNGEGEATICYKYYLSPESKEEHEYPFSAKEAHRIYNNHEELSSLTKFRFKRDGWDIDKYIDHDLIVAEYEFTDENPLPNPLPNWIGEEVTGQYEYTNPALAKNKNHENN